MKHEQSLSMRKAWLAFKGASLIEVMLATATLTLVLTALSGAYVYGQQSTALAGARARATLLAEEGLEAVRNMRDADFANVTNGTYGLSTSTGTWTLAGSNDVTDIFTRTVTIATVDSDRKSVTADVSWQQNAQRTGSVSLASRLAYWTRVVPLVGNWALASTSATIDLATTNNGTKVAIAGNYAYVVWRGSANFVVINLTNPDSPTVAASLTLSGTLSSVFVSGNYAYVSSNDNNNELTIVNVTNPLVPVVAGTYNDSGSEDAADVFVSGSYAYLALAGGNDFVVVNVSNPASPSFTGGLVLNGNADEVVVSGNYAYVASSDDNQELQVVNVTNRASPSLVGTNNLSGNNDATAIAVSSSTAYLAQANMLRLINITTPSAPALVGSYNATSTIQDIAINLAIGNTLFLATTDDTAEFQAVNVSTSTAPILLKSINTVGTDNLNGIAYDGTLDRVVGVGDADTAEVMVFKPQ